MPETQHELVLTLFVDNLGNFSAEQLSSLKDEVNDLVRCAFRENSLYQVKQTWPYSRFSFSNLGRELHRQFSDIQSLHFSLGISPASSRTPFNIISGRGEKCLTSTKTQTPYAAKLDGQGEPAKLLAALRRFWTLIYGWLTWPLAQLDAETCTESLLNLLAYQRDIQRFNGEPLIYTASG